MRSRWVGAFVAMAFGCKQEAPATPPAPAPARPAVVANASPATPAVPPAMAAVDAGTVLPIRHAVHATCGLEFAAADAGVQYIDRDAGLSPSLNAQRTFQCALPDGGVVWTIPYESNDQVQGAVFVSKLYQTTARQNPERMRRELAGWDEDSARHEEGTVLPGFLFRAPDRAVGKSVRIEGTAQNVREQNGETSLTVSLDLLGREVIEIRFPGLASDDVVNGANVVIYGRAVGSHTVEARRGGEQVVPEVVAYHIAPQAEGSPQEQTQRVLRRLRHH